MQALMLAGWPNMSALTEHKRRMVRLERQRLVIGFERSHIDQCVRISFSGRRASQSMTNTESI